MKKRLMIPSVLSLFIVFGLLLMSCSIFDIFKEYKENMTVIQKKTYSIDATTILESIKRGNTDVFVLQTEPITASQTLPQDLVNWQEEDYLLITKTFISYVLNDSLNKWSLGSMSFKLDCDETSYGTQMAHFFFFRLEPIGKGESSRIERYIRIYPKNNELTVNEYKFSPSYSNFTSIDLSRTKINLEKALQIAENNGGTKARQENEDQCEIIANLDINGKYEGWEIKYSSISGKEMGDLLHLNVDLITGVIKAIQ